MTTRAPQVHLKAEQRIAQATALLETGWYTVKALAAHMDCTDTLARGYAKRCLNVRTRVASRAPQRSVIEYTCMPEHT